MCFCVSLSSLILNTRMNCIPKMSIKDTITTFTIKKRKFDLDALSETIEL